jgi:hypothetical protein
MCICFCYSIPLKELRANIRFREGFRGVIKDSVVSMRPRKLLPRSIWDRESRFRGLYETAEAASAVYKRTRKLLPRSIWDNNLPRRWFPALKFSVKAEVEFIFGATWREEEMRQPLLEPVSRQCGPVHVLLFTLFHEFLLKKKKTLYACIFQFVGIRCYCDLFSIVHWSLFFSEHWNYNFSLCFFNPRRCSPRH